MKSNKVPGPDEKVVEEIKCFDEFAIEKGVTLLKCFFEKNYKISWTSHTSNEDLLKQFGYEKRKLIQIVLPWQLKFFSDIMRKERMENLTTTGKIAGKGDRGQQRITFVKSLCHLLNIATFQFLQSVKDRVLFRSMVANILKG
ncbi:hypothetical protein HELRODRAFT_178659 [Helobdella robusta]|uniref:Uncharacterized protein n=1 Tax=Helobdella robusta TaxID=6412 RepID=T1FDI6_HELRO|nr:hypothetical protein HELRODRAFT_178659 [Helobdella robusta]ESN96859.1 hypothetical protein HELRODRAFT_178659 [Helobdella robusta]